MTEPIRRSRALQRRVIGLVGGPAALLVTLAVPPPAALGEAGWRMAGTAVLMAVWWVTEVIPIPATALLPVVLFPALGIMPIERATAPFANPIIFLFLGGFLIAAAVESSGLHRRLALHIIRLVGTAPARTVGGFMAATAFLSMWVSNTATVVMLLPLAVSVIELHARGPGPDPRFGVALLLGLAYAASLGGLGTLIGTPPNALLAAFLAEAHGIRIGFAAWMLLGLPVVLVSVPLAWFLLTRVLHPLPRAELPGASDLIRRELASLGPATRAERRVAIVTLGAALGWVFRPLLDDLIPGLSDAGIAVTAGVIMFLLPGSDQGGRVLDWQRAERLPWGALVFFGGGLALAAGIQSTGLADWIGGGLGGLAAFPVAATTAAVALLIIFLTEFTSNTATAAAFLPVMAALAAEIGVEPVVLAVPAALAASSAFMMPIATPPNAIVYASGRLALGDMLRAGAVLNIVMVPIITAAALLLAPRVFP